MIPFFPDTPITLAYAAALVVASTFALWGGWRAVPVVAVMVLNWIGTRAMPDASPLVIGLLDMICAAMLAGAWFWWRAMAVLPVAACYCLMVSFYLLADLSYIGRETMWAFVDVFGYIQCLVIAGAPFGPGAARRLAPRGADGAGDRRVAGAVARRVPPA